MSSSKPAKRPPSRRGRPRAGEQEARRRAVTQAAMAEVLEKGFDKVTMLGVAKRAGSSKETLYSWFGSKEGLFSTLISENGEGAAERVKAALEGEADPVETLVGFGTGLLLLLTGPESVALNRAAMTSPDLSKLLLAGGRHRVGPIIEAYLDRLNAEGTLHIEDSAAAFTTLYGLIIQDTQIRVLLGEPAPSPTQARQRAEQAVSRFVVLYSQR